MALMTVLNRMNIFIKIFLYIFEKFKNFGKK